MKIKLFLSFAILAFCILPFQNCSNSGMSVPTNSNQISNGAPPETTPPEGEIEDPLYWLEPSGSTVIGVGQTIYTFPALKNNAADLYPAYLNSQLIMWSSSTTSSAVVSSDGTVAGIAVGTTQITAPYQGHTAQLNVQVSGVMQSRNVAVPGQGTRKYYIYIPDFGTALGPHPLVLSLHGGGGFAMEQAAKSHLNKLAHEQKFYAVYPEGSGVIQTFNAGACCGTAQTNNVNDVLYIKNIIADVQANFNVNAAKVFSTGFSNGAMMSHRLACALSDKISGIAAVSGGSGQFDFSLTQYYSCTPTRPIPILHFHAKNDRNYPYVGGSGGGVSGTNFYPVDSTIADWIARNNVTPVATIEVINSTTKCYRYTTQAESSRPSAPVVLCVIDPPDIYDTATEIVFGGGHSWHGGVRSSNPSSDTPLKGFNASAYLWNFLNNP